MKLQRGGMGHPRLPNVVNRNANAATGEITDPNESPEMPPPSDDEDDDSPF